MKGENMCFENDSQALEELDALNPHMRDGFEFVVDVDLGAWRCRKDEIVARLKKKHPDFTSDELNEAMADTYFELVPMLVDLRKRALDLGLSHIADEALFDEFIWNS